jgi:hypothetical protein
MLASIQGLLLHNLVSENRGLRVTLFLVVEGSTSAATFYFLFDDEVGLHQTVLALERVFADVFKDFLAIIFLFLPF